VLHANAGQEVSATVLQTLISRLAGCWEEEKDAEGEEEEGVVKYAISSMEPDNAFTLISHLYHFKVGLSNERMNE